jgi:hypothetical protein
LRPERALSNYLLHPFEISWILWMVIRKVKFLNLSINKCSWSHARAAFMMSPSVVRIFGHLACRKCVGCSLLMGWSIIKQEQARCKTVCPVLKDVDGPVNLGKEIISIKISIAIFASFENNASISVKSDKEFEIDQMMIRYHTPFHLHSSNAPTLKSRSRRS